MLYLVLISVLAALACIVLVVKALSKIEIEVKVVVPEIEIKPDTRLIDAMNYAENALQRMEQEAREERAKRITEQAKAREERMDGESDYYHPRRPRLKNSGGES